jgi:toxin ParE1/3/4
VKRRQARYAPEADQDFDWIYDFISRAGGPATAFECVQRLRDFCQGLEYASERGSQRGDIREGLRIVGFERRVTVVFSVGESRVTILRLFYGGQDWEGALR